MCTRLASPLFIGPIKMSKKTNTTLKPQPKSTVKTTHYFNGQVMSKNHYVNDKRHGVETEWWDNGHKRREVMWNDGKKHGVATGWLKDGRKWYERMWKDGKAHGLETWRRDNGKKSQEILYQDGKQHGVTTSWYTSGGKSEEIYYLVGEEYAEIEWDESGSLAVASFPTPFQQQTHQQQDRSSNQRKIILSRK